MYSIHVPLTLTVKDIELIEWYLLHNGYRNFCYKVTHHDNITDCVNAASQLTNMMDMLCLSEIKEIEIYAGKANSVICISTEPITSISLLFSHDSDSERIAQQIRTYLYSKGSSIIRRVLDWQATFTYYVIQFMLILLVSAIIYYVQSPITAADMFRLHLGFATAIILMLVGNTIIMSKGLNSTVITRTPLSKKLRLLLEYLAYITPTVSQIFSWLTGK